MSNFRFTEVNARHPATTFADAVHDGLSRSPKTLPCRFFYDEAGSALFERICDLPEYYPTRTERKILEACAPAIIEAAGPNIALIELGSGSSVKTRLLIEAALARQARLHYVPIDISVDFLRASAQTLMSEYERLCVRAIAAEYSDGIARLPEHDGPRLLLFLGSNIGNFNEEEATEFLQRLRRVMQPHDRILIGVDLVKERHVLESAYNDAEGITAAFNKNLLARINRELGGRFDLNQWEHRAPFIEDASRIEMWLISRKAQKAGIAALDREFCFAEGEGIHTENSHKYTPARFAAVCHSAGLSVQEQWRDERAWFAVMLLKPENAA